LPLELTLALLAAPQGHTLLTRLSGAQPAVLSAALKSHASKPSTLASSSQQPVAAKTVYQPGEQASGAASARGTVAGGAAGDDDEDEDDVEDESDEELQKRCEALMTQSDVVLFMKGDRNTPRCVPLSLALLISPFLSGASSRSTARS